MGQYKHNFYGTSYYGATNAYSGLYETNYINTDETLKGVVNTKIKAHLPKAFYGIGAEEIVSNVVNSNLTKVSGVTYNKPFDYRKVTNLTTTLKMSATADYFCMHFLSMSDSVVEVNVEIRKYTNELEYTSTNHIVPVKKAVTTVSQWAPTLTGYGTYEFIVSFPAGSTGSFLLGGCEIGATHLTVETRASLNETAWTSYQQMTYTKTLIEGDWYYLEGVTPSYSGKNRLQLRIYMASSDNQLSPIIEDILTTSGNTNNRTEDGTWIAEIDMKAVATAATKTFKKVTGIDWVDTIPVGTAMTYQSKSADTLANLVRAPLSVPYQKNTRRLRLKDGRNNGYVTTALLNPANRNPNLQNLFWFEWKDQSFLPVDHVETGYRYEFLDEKNTVIHSIQNPSTENYKLLEKAIKNRPFKLRIQLFKRYDKATPVVDSITFSSKIHYTEDKVVSNQNISTVDARGTGEKVTTNMTSLVYNFPAELSRSTVEYKLIDETARPTGVGQDSLYLFFESEKNSTSKSNVTNNPDDLVWARCIGREANEAIGSLRHYQYGGGSSYFETDKANLKKYLLTSAFSPSLIDGKVYRNFIQVGWPTQYHKVSKGETLHSISILYSTTEEAILQLEKNAYLKDATSFNADGTILEGQTIEIPNKTINENVKVYWEPEKDMVDGVRTYLSENIVHNGKQNENIMAEVVEAFAKGEVDWVSEEKIYDGFLNINNLASPYQREHLIPNEGKDQEHEHPVKTGETYLSIAALYGINEEDIRWKNGVKDKLATDTPIVGSILIVPSKVVLPSVPSNVKIGEVPYQLEIVHNSVRVGNENMPKEIIEHVGLEVVYKRTSVIRQPVKRGMKANTSDFLPNSKIVSVDGIYNSLVESVGASYYVAGVDYNLIGNSVDWSLKNAVGKEPATGNIYYVSYTYNKPVGVKIKINSDYQVQTGSDILWRSKEIKDFSGTATPEQDYRQELPPIQAWSDYNTKDVYDVDYVIEDNDVWVKTWIEEQNQKNYIIGSLMGKQPKDNWIPYIHTGYYYLGKEERYLFSEALVEELGEQDIPIAQNVVYANGKYQNAIQVQPSSKNLVRNSGFEVQNKKSVIRKITF